MTDQEAALAGAKTLWGGAADAVRRAIVSGKLADGARVSEASLAETLGVSRRAPVSRLGLLCIQPNELVHLRGGAFGRAGRYHLSGALRWIECPRDDAAFLGAVLDVLTQPEPPPPSPDCGFCRYRRLAQRTGW